MSRQRTGKTKILYLVKLAVLVAIMLILSATPIGYIRIGPIVATVIQVPVLIGAVLLGPLAGVILGAVFATTSIMQAITGADPFGAFIFNANPLAVVFTCYVPRILMGFLAGMLFKLLKRFDRKNYYSSSVTGFVGSLINTVLYLSALVILTKDLVAEAMSIPAEAVVGVAVGVGVTNGIPEAVASLVIVTAVSKAMDAYNR